MYTILLLQTIPSHYPLYSIVLDYILYSHTIHYHHTAHSHCTFCPHSVEKWTDQIRMKQVIDQNWPDNLESDHSQNVYTFLQWNSFFSTDFNITAYWSVYLWYVHVFVVTLHQFTEMFIIIIVVVAVFVISYYYRYFHFFFFRLIGIAIVFHIYITFYACASAQWNTHTHTEDWMF